MHFEIEAFLHIPADNRAEWGHYGDDEHPDEPVYKTPDFDTACSRARSLPLNEIHPASRVVRVDDNGTRTVIVQYGELPG